MAKYTQELIAPLVAKSSSYSGVIRLLGMPQAGGTQAHLKRVIQKLGLDTSHFTGKVHNRGVASPKRLNPEEILVRDRRNGSREKLEKLRRALQLSGVADCCKLCGISPEWNGKSLVLQVDHADGDFLNNTLDNLRLLCPNCHSQTETFCRQKKKLHTGGGMVDTSDLGSDGRKVVRVRVPSCVRGTLSNA